MDAILTNVNWTAVIIGTIASFALGHVWFGKLFGGVWATGSHNITLPARPAMLPMAGQLLGTFLMAWVIGATASIAAPATAVVVILAVAVLQFSGALFSQKSLAAALIEGGFVGAMGAIMIAVQAII